MVISKSPYGYDKYEHDEPNMSHARSPGGRASKSRQSDSNELRSILKKNPVTINEVKLKEEIILNDRQ